MCDKLRPIKPGLVIPNMGYKVLAKNTRTGWYVTPVRCTPISRSGWCTAPVPASGPLDTDRHHAGKWSVFRTLASACDAAGLIPDSCGGGLFYPHVDTERVVALVGMRGEVLPSHSSSWGGSWLAEEICVLAELIVPDADFAYEVTYAE